MQLTMETAVDLANKCLFEDDDVVFAFGYEDIRDSKLVIAVAEDELCIPVCEQIALVEPIETLGLKDPDIVKHMIYTTFPGAFKLYIKATASSYFFGGVEQKEQEFFRVLGPDSTWVNLLEAMYDIFVEAKVHPQEPMLIHGIKLEGEGLVRIEWDESYLKAELPAH